MRRSIQLDAERRRVLVTNDFGDYAVLSDSEHDALAADALLGSQAISRFRIMLYQADRPAQRASARRSVWRALG